MNGDVDKSVEDRISELETICAEQRAHIDGLSTILSDLMAAYVVNQKDLRLCAFVGSYVQSDLAQKRKGGTQSIPASLFGARADLQLNVPTKTAESTVFDNFWFRSFFVRREEKQIKSLNSMREKIQRKIDQLNA